MVPCFFVQEDITSTYIYQFYFYPTIQSSGSNTLLCAHAHIDGLITNDKIQLIEIKFEGTQGIQIYENIFNIKES